MTETVPRIRTRLNNKDRGPITPYGILYDDYKKIVEKNKFTCKDIGGIIWKYIYPNKSRYIWCRIKKDRINNWKQIYHKRWNDRREYLFEYLRNITKYKAYKLQILAFINDLWDKECCEMMELYEGRRNYINHELL
jgi:hypothetical protein